MTNGTILPDRAEIPLEETWDTASMFASREDWETAYKEVERKIPHLESFQGRLGESTNTLLGWLATTERVFNVLEKLKFFAFFGIAVDSNDQDSTALMNRAISLYAKAGAAAAFAEPELMSLDPEKLKGWKKKVPAMAVYDHYFQRLLDQKPHIRSQEVEEVMALTVDPFETATAARHQLVNGEMQFSPAIDSERNKHEVGQGSIETLKTSGDRELRRTAWESYADGHLAFKGTLANCLNAAFKQDVFNMRARRYPSSLEASLAPNRIPPEVFHNLIEVFKKNLPTWHRYWRVRRKALGVDVLYPYDIHAPLTQNPPVVSFAQAIDWIADGLAPLGEAYVDVLRQGVLEKRWVDRLPNKGKRAGAFSYGAYGTHPFIMMSYADQIFDVSTLAHELGHSMHSYLTWQNHPWVYSNSSLFVAEVASNFNQALVRAHLFETQSDRDFQIALIEERMSNFYRYFFIMPSLARFELETHEQVEQGSALTADTMNDLMANLFEEGYGDEVQFDRERVGITWAQFAHLYINFFVYQYATGIAAAHHLAKDVLAGENGAVERYLDFLKAGSSVYPLDALQIAGVDMTSPQPVEAAFSILGETVDMLEKLFA